VVSPEDNISKQLGALDLNWHARNEATHSEPLPWIESSKSFLTGYMRILKKSEDFIDRRYDQRQATSSDWFSFKLGWCCTKKAAWQYWELPPTGWVKLNCDGSVKLEDGSARAGMVLRDENGHIILGLSSVVKLF
jgi:hypothetical protein